MTRHTGYTITGILLGIGDKAGSKIPAWAYMVSLSPSFSTHLSIYSILPPTPLSRSHQTVLGAICGFIGSLVDSLVGGVLQASWYCPERKTIVKRPSIEDVDSGAVRLISGSNVLSNEQVNVLSVSKASRGHHHLVLVTSK